MNTVILTTMRAFHFPKLITFSFWIYRWGNEVWLSVFTFHCGVSVTELSLVAISAFAFCYIAHYNNFLVPISYFCIGLISLRSINNCSASSLLMALSKPLDTATKALFLVMPVAKAFTSGESNTATSASWCPLCLPAHARFSSARFPSMSAVLEWLPHLTYA